MRFLIQTNECVNTVRIHFPWCVMFIIYILRFKFLFNDKLCCLDSSPKLIKVVSMSYINVLTVDTFSQFKLFIVDDTHHGLVIFLQVRLKCLCVTFYSDTHHTKIQIVIVSRTISLSNINAIYHCQA